MTRAMSHSAVRRFLATLGMGAGKGTPMGAGMMTGMRQRDRRALIVGVVCIGTLVGFSRGLPAWREWRHDVREEALAAITERARAEALLTMRRAIEDSLAARNERFVSLAPALLGGGSPAAAGATLAGLVSGAAATSGVRLGAVQIRPDTASSSAFTRISVRADAMGDVRGVTNMLSALERGPTLLAIRSLAIDQPDPAATSEQMEALRVTLVVEGLMLTPRAVEPRDGTSADTSSRASTSGSSADDPPTTPSP